MGFLITYITLDISYSNDKKVRIRKIHKDIESEELKKSKYKIDDDETYIYDNQIDLDMFSAPKMESLYNFRKRYLKPESEGFHTQLKDLSRYGGALFRYDEDWFRHKEDFFRNSIAIYVSMKNPDEQLNDNICSVLHQLCRKYLKTGIMFTSRDGIICRIDNCSYSENVLKKFLEDFVITTEKTILREI